MADGTTAFADDVDSPLSDVGDAEVGLIACALADEERKHKVVARASLHVGPESFGNTYNGQVWRAIVAAVAGGAVADPVTIAEEIGPDPRAQKALAEAASRIGSPAAVEQYAERVAAHHYRRTVRAVLCDAYQRAGAAGPPLPAVTAAHEALKALPKGPRSRLDDSMKASVKSTLRRIEERRLAAEGGMRATARWGVRALDGWHCEDFGFYEGAVGGLFPGKLYVLAGLPGGGKTSLVWQAALATARGDEKSKGKRVLVFSLEMTREDICQRLAAQGLGIPETRLENGAITAEEYDAIAEWMNDRLAELPINIITDCRTIEEMRARVLAELAGPDGVGLVVIDFLQRAKMGRRGDDGHRDEQDRVYEAKGIANEGVPVIAVSSMSKSSQARATEGKVGVSDTSGSGTEYAADLVAFLVRTNPEDKGARVEVRFEVVKRRGGPLSSVTLVFDMTTGQFSTRNEGNQ